MMNLNDLTRRSIPICCYCGQVRRPDGVWHPADLSDSAEVLLSHGICPTCYDTEVRPQLEELAQADSAWFQQGD